MAALPIAALWCLALTAILAGRQLPAQPANVFPDTILTNWWWRSCSAAVAWNTWETARDQQSRIVAVLDSGVDFHHQQLANRLWTNWAEASGMPDYDDDGNGKNDDVHGWNFVRNQPPQPTDAGPQRHGTMVSGLIAAKPATGRRAAGIAPGGRLMIVQYSPNGGTTSNAEQLVRLTGALAYALSNKADIINISSHIPIRLTNSAEVTAMLGFSNLLASSAAINTLVVCAAPTPNIVTDLDDASRTLVVPAALDHPNLITVTGLDPGSPETMTSRSGKKAVDIAAPASNIVSLIPGNEEAEFHGNSYATALVSGAAALVWGMMPKLTAREVRCLLLSNAATNNVKIASPLPGEEWGYTPPAKPNSKLDLSFVTNVYPSYLAYQAGQRFTNCCFGLTEQQNGCRETQ